MYVLAALERNILRGSGHFTLDTSLFNDVAVSERVDVQFRGELFNVLQNHPQFDLPNATIGNAQSGIISATGTPRDIQLGLRIVF